MERATLESFLAPISEQLGRASVPDVIRAYESVEKPPARLTDGLKHPELVEMFANEGAKVQVDVRVCKSSKVADAIIDIIEDGGAEVSVVYADDKRFKKLDIPEALDGEKLVTKATRWDASAGRDAMIDACNDAQFGITFALGGIAETGTIVQPCSPTCGRSISLLPTEHIAIVNAADIKPTLGDWMAELQQMGGAHGDNLPSQVCFISGPSVTSDIELVRVEGVHGPMKVHYIVIEGKGLHSKAS